MYTAKQNKTKLKMFPFFSFLSFFLFLRVRMHRANRQHEGQLVPHCAQRQWGHPVPLQRRQGVYVDGAQALAK
jgi:hypothetical protein